MFDLSIGIICTVALVSCICEYVDSTLGMGYGTALTPVLLLLGFAPTQVVPAVLFSELVSGLLAAFLHHRHGNVDFKPKSTKISLIVQKLKALGYIEHFKQDIPRNLKSAILLAVCSIAGTVAAVFVAVNIPRFWLKMYIGCLVLAMGLIIAICINREFRFSWKKLGLLGVIASFNKGMSGGGYGPVVTCGQVLSGIDGTNAVGITSLAEGLTCLVGVITYKLVMKDNCDWSLAPWLTVGAVISVPFSVISVKLLGKQRMKIAIAAITIILGAYTIYNTLK